MLLAGDVGGTKTLLGLFEHDGRRPRPVAVHSYPTSTFESFIGVLDAFARDAGSSLRIDAAAMGVAGPVVGGTAQLTNIPWSVSAADIARRFDMRAARLLNDLEAMAFSVEVLTPQETAILQEGMARADGNAAVIAAGTGLGEAYLHRVNGRLVPLPTESGHADFAARTDREMALLRMLRQEYGRASVEHVLSGPGLVNLHRFTHGGEVCHAVHGLDATGAPAGISQAALGGTCRGCVEALEIFVQAYGAEAGNLALRGTATSGVYVGGGIAPKILPSLQDGRFIEAFRAKAPMAALVARIPVKVILNSEAALLGAAVAAEELSGGHPQ